MLHFWSAQTWITKLLHSKHTMPGLPDTLYMVCPLLQDFGHHISKYLALAMVAAAGRDDNVDVTFVNESRLFCTGWQWRSVRVQRPAEQLDAHRRQQFWSTQLCRRSRLTRLILRRLDLSDHRQLSVEPTYIGYRLTHWELKLELEVCQ